MAHLSDLRSEFGTIVEAAKGEAIDDLDLDLLFKTFRERGVLLMRGFPVYEGILNRFASRFGGAFVSHGAPGRTSIDATSFVHQPDPGMHSINLHSELGYFPVFPDTIWFQCLTPPAAAGETVICDGVALWESIDEEYRSLFRARRLRYTGLWAAPVWQRYWQVDDVEKLKAKLSKLENVRYSVSDDHLYYEYVVSALKRTAHCGQEAFANSLIHYYSSGMKRCVAFEDGERIPDALIDHLLARSKPLTEAVTWQGNDILMIDNSRVMHGRNAHSDPQRKLCALMASIAG